MYRTPPGKTPRTVIVYQARDVRVVAFLVAALSSLFAYGVLASVHTTTIACRRTNAVASCTVDRSGIRPLHLVLPVDAITGFDVQPSPKVLPTARVDLLIQGSSSSRFLELETSPLGGGIDIETASNARRRFLRFQNDPSQTAFDVSLSRSFPMKALLLLIGLALATLALRCVYEPLRELRPIRVVVDRQRRVIVIGKRIVPLDQVHDVIVEKGVIVPFVRRQGEADPPGYRLVVVLKNDDEIPATREWRPGPRSVHEAARQRVLVAMDPLAST